MGRGIFNALTLGMMCSVVWDSGAWQLSVAVGKRGEPPAPKAGVTYEFLIWARDLPTVSARRPADIGPLP